MSYVSGSDIDQLFKDVDEYARGATWCALATVHKGEPRVRMVHPTWEGRTLWFATGPETLKAQQIEGAPVHNKILMMRDALETFVAMDSKITKLDSDNTALREDLAKREEALKRLRELTLGQKVE